MTVWAVVVAFAGALNPVRRRGCLSVGRARDVAAGAALAWAAYVVVALVGSTTRDALDVSAPNARVAAGLVLVAVGLHATVTPLPHHPVDDAPRAWLAPVAFPVLLRPDLALVALGADGAAGVGVVSAAAAAALALTAWWAVAPTQLDPRAARAVGALGAAALVVAAVRLVLDGVFAI